jgi:hypothetical protein
MSVTTDARKGYQVCCPPAERWRCFAGSIVMAYYANAHCSPELKNADKKRRSDGLPSRTS